MREFLCIFVKTVESLKTFMIFFALMFTTFTSTMIILIKNKDRGALEDFYKDKEYNHKTFEDAGLEFNFWTEFYQIWTHVYWTFVIFITGVDNPGYDLDL